MKNKSVLKKILAIFVLAAVVCLSFLLFGCDGDDACYTCRTRYEIDFCFPDAQTGEMECTTYHNATYETYDYSLVNIYDEDGNFVLKTGVNNVVIREEE